MPKDVIPLRASLLCGGSVVGYKEYQGPLGSLFDYYNDKKNDGDLFGQKTFEAAEAEMQHMALGCALGKQQLSPDALDAIYAGDLQNQCAASAYGLLSYDVPFFGLYGACSTMVEGLLLSAIGISGGAFSKTSTNSEYILGVTIPESVTAIGDNAFKECSNLESIVIPDAVKTIGNYAFQNCFSLEDVTIGAGLKSIGKYAFQECSSIESIVIPDKVESIGDYAFKQCSNMASLTIGASVKSIGRQAFYDCYSLEEITMLNGDIDLGAEVFHNTGWYDCQRAGVLYMNELLYGYKGIMPENEQISVKEGTKAIGGNAFDGCTNLKGITLPEGLERIGC